MATTAASSSSRPLHLTIRFTTTHPDLPLTITTPNVTTPLHLKQQIRSALPSPLNTRQLRLIHAGKPFPDNKPLSRLVKPPPPPPPTRKGKEPLRTVDDELRWTPVYIHCSIGPALSAAELEAEAASAAALTKSLTQSARTHSSQSSSPGRQSHHRRPSSLSEPQQEEQSTTPRPIGFDRLLTSGFTTAEVATLHSHFLALLSQTHTPETLPSPREIRVLEDRWLDSSSTPGSIDGMTNGGVGEGFGEDDEGEAGGLDDMVFGTLIGFFWPVAAVMWVREEGVWTRRRKVAVLAGVVVNAVFGAFKLTS